MDVVISNRSISTFTGPFVLRFAQAEHVGAGVTGARPDREGVPFLNVTAQFPQGASVGGAASRTWVVQMGREGTAPKLRAEVFGRRPVGPVPLLVTRTLQADGLPLEVVAVEEIGPASPRQFQSGRGGWLTLEAGPGVNGWRFNADGRAPSFRVVPTGLSQGVTELASVRLAELGVAPDAQSLPACT